MKWSHRWCGDVILPPGPIPLLARGLHNGRQAGHDLSTDPGMTSYGLDALAWPLWQILAYAHRCGSPLRACGLPPSLAGATV